MTIQMTIQMMTRMTTVAGRVLPVAALAIVLLSLFALPTRAGDHVREGRGQDHPRTSFETPKAWSDGIVTNQFDNRTFWSDGRSAAQFGSMVIFGDGTVATRSGDQTLFGNGRSCAQYGATTICD